MLTVLYNPRLSSLVIETTGKNPRQLDELIKDFKVSVLPRFMTTFKAESFIFFFLSSYSITSLVPEPRSLKTIGIAIKSFRLTSPSEASSLSALTTATTSSEINRSYKISLFFDFPSTIPISISPFNKVSVMYCVFPFNNDNLIFGNFLWKADNTCGMTYCAIVVEAPSFSWPETRSLKVLISKSSLR